MPQGSVGLWEQNVLEYSEKVYESIPLIWETRYKMWQEGGKHQNMLGDVQDRTTSRLYLRCSQEKERSCL
ncbi:MULTISPECIES: hypothetical protein [Chroococcidiopsis]|uniref:hypothetical protein n=1 Tax=Chroococcidiopsis TaxID=54298 RepID=UPI000F8CA381|nr:MULTISPECIES: hypothetical protein [Chroococcidiopsis]